MSDDERDLIRRALAGDKEALAGLFRRYEQRLFNTVYRLLGNEKDAQQVVQETFIKAYESLREFRGDRQFFTWLYRIAYHAAINLRRRKQRVEAAASKVAEQDLKEDERRIEAALARLSPDLRIVFQMKDMERKKWRTLADTLGLPVETLRHRLQQARLQLRELLSQEKRVDGQLIAQALGGDDHAFGDLMARYRETLSTILSELLDDPRERMTAQVQLFFRVRESLGRYRDDKPFVTWLYEIARIVTESKKGPDIPPG